MDLRPLQPEAIGSKSICPGIHGQGRSQVRSGLQHVAQVLRRRRVAPHRNPRSGTGNLRRRGEPPKEEERLVRVPRPRGSAHPRGAAT